MDFKSRFLPPLRNEHTNSTQIATLFEKYLSFTIKNTPTKFHTVSYEIFKIIKASSVSLDTEALVLSIAVENVIKKMNCENHKEDKKFQGKIKDAGKVLANTKIHDSIKKRLIGFLGSIIKVKPKDLLEHFVRKNIITKSHYEAWKALRNAAAHGDLNNFEVQNLLDLSYNVQQLFYNLIFILINYQGEYNDYSGVNFPIKYFSAKEEMSF